MSSNSRSQRNQQRTPIYINVYDLLPPGKISTILWTIGCGLLHTGVVVGDREYAFGGHDKKGETGVYWMKPRTEPPGGRYRCEVFQGHCYQTEEDINRTILAATEVFLGPSYNLLSRNCNHFTSYMCELLTGKPAPKWINRAAGIGVSLPCIVPTEWIEPPECDEPFDSEAFEEEVRLVHRRRLGGTQFSRDDADDSSGDEWGERRPASQGVHREGRKMKDQGGRQLPPAERAPVK